MSQKVTGLKGLLCLLHELQGFAGEGQDGVVVMGTTILSGECWAYYWHMVDAWPRTDTSGMAALGCVRLDREQAVNRQCEWHE